MEIELQQRRTSDYNKGRPSNKDFQPLDQHEENDEYDSDLLKGRTAGRPGPPRWPLWESHRALAGGTKESRRGIFKVKPGTNSPLSSSV